MYPQIFTLCHVHVQMQQHILEPTHSPEWVTVLKITIAIASLPPSALRACYISLFRWRRAGTSSRPSFPEIHSSSVARGRWMWRQNWAGDILRRERSCLEERGTLNSQLCAASLGYCLVFGSLNGSLRSRECLSLFSGVSFVRSWWRRRRRIVDDDDIIILHY